MSSGSIRLWKNDNTQNDKWILKIDKGQILVDGQDITTLAPEKRPVSTVFQSYALFPHMSVLENVIYGLKFRGIRKKKPEKWVWNI